MGWSGGNYSKGNAATGGWAGDVKVPMETRLYVNKVLTNEREA
jgi:hypothetical protein